MQRILRAVFIMLCASGFALFAASPQLAQAQQAGRVVTHQVSQASTDSAAQMGALQDAKKCMRGCHDCWYNYFPGAVDYCLGMRDWKKGAYRSGLELLDLAASWGSKEAQYTLGLIYYNGHHVAVDRARGIAWLMLANERHNDAQTDLVARSAVRLATAGQYQRAQQLLQEMRKRYGDKVAGVRAWRHLRNRLKTSRLQTHALSWSASSCILEGGGVAPWSSDLSADPHVLCLLSGRFSKNVAGIVGKYFDGLTGTVTVGPMQQVTAPASPSTR